MTDRKAELARLCRLEIRKTSALSKSRMSEYGYHLVEAVVDAEVEVMMERLTDKSVQSDDVPILRELVIADLWPRLKAAHRERRDVAFRKLIADFPDIVVHYGDFAFDGGWIPLVRDAVERMRTYPTAWKIRLDGGKEKFGCLVLFVSCVVAERGAMSEVMRMREEIRLRSLATCEICGASGRLRLGGYAMTVCDKHSAIFEGFREDDGVWADPWRWSDDVDCDPPPSALTEKIAADIKQLSGRERELLNRFLLEIEEAVHGCAARGADIDTYVSAAIEQWVSSDLDPAAVTDDDKAWLHGYVREAIEEEHERIRGEG